MVCQLFKTSKFWTLSDKCLVILRKDEFILHMFALVPNFVK